MVKVITSESVFEGHPDKVCDQIRDAILDSILNEDIDARVAVETAIKSNNVYIISVDQRGTKDQGAGVQGMMYGYTTNETAELIPALLALAHKIARKYKEIRETKYLHYFEPDGKCQVSYAYENDKPVRIETIVVSTQTKPGVKREDYVKVIIEEVLEPLIDEVDDIKILINPTGEFLIGGHEADSGLTGRKIIVDTYGGFSHHGGGVFSGKDTSKVDRSAAYYARYAAKSFVNAGLAERVEVGVAYSIGVSEPVSLYLDTFNTGVVSDDELLKMIKNHFNFTPSNIRKELYLDNVKFRQLSKFGHVGRIDLNVKWEHPGDKVEELIKVYEKTKSVSQLL